MISDVYRWAAIAVLTGCHYTASPVIEPDAPADAAAPVDVADPCTVTQIESYGAHTCVVRADRSAWCWGNDDHLEIGVASTTPAFNGAPCVPTPIQVPVDPVLALGMGDEHTCATTTTGVTCWGRNQDGELGTGTAERATPPVAVPARAGAVGFAGGQSHICSIDALGAVECAGANTLGEVGDGTAMPRIDPVTVNLGGVATALAGGYNHACAIVAGAVKCWGSNAGKQINLSNNSIKASPFEVAGIANATRVAAGFAHTCALLDDGTARCWGTNDKGQLGNGAQSLPSSPVTVTLQGITALSAGVDHTCAIAQGEVHCWGELYTATPLPVTLPAAPALISAGSYHDCAVLTDGTTWCWHWQGYGQLGTGNVENVFTTAPMQAATCP